ncbi:plant UBX domain-containing protein 10 [Cucumis melo var. makuwa]|uniref:Plant UBX domain-containing protein 10 n=1 Tax=Cucumis melo var. makuwa TaxID=1194695 RepID=A0A5A7TIQ5_CUCMM|nr:plant UBX domain-containing protein 10 [Cucumis melo var. makuwa]
MSLPDMVDVADKLAYFQAITGLEDPEICTEILAAHGWDLELAVSSFTGTNSESSASAAADGGGGGGDAHFDPPTREILDRPEHQENAAPAPSLAWKIITLPISVISGSLGLVSGAVGLGLWAAGGILSYSLGVVGFGSGSGRNAESSARLVSVSAAASEAIDFVSAFERDYGMIRPSFVGEGFMDALQRSRNAFKLLFVYLHSPDHPDTPLFCERTLCSETVAAFVNENFVSWGGSIRASEGFKMSNSLKASRYPFCAVVMAATNQRIALLQQVEGPKTAEEMLVILQRVLEESAPVLVSARLDAEERRNNMRLREEQDAAYRAALEADQVCYDFLTSVLHQLKFHSLRRAAREAAEREAALARMRQEKAMSLGAEPEKGPNVTQVLVRFPTGERKERRFHSTASIQTLYDYVDSLGCLEVDSYNLVSNFPRVVYGADKLSLSLKEAGLHPQASLFVDLTS